MTGKHATTKSRDRPRSDLDVDPGIPILVALRLPSGWAG
jgi:hypothetical protein